MSAGTDAINEVFVGIIERGCSPAEAIDYYMVEIGPYNQTEWAAIRGINQQAVSENVNKARKKII